jgi:hypothetical protein
MPTLPNSPSAVKSFFRNFLPDRTFVHLSHCRFVQRAKLRRRTVPPCLPHASDFHATFYTTSLLHDCTPLAAFAEERNRPRTSHVIWATSAKTAGARVRYRPPQFVERMALGRHASERGRISMFARSLYCDRQTRTGRCRETWMSPARTLPSRQGFHGSEPSILGCQVSASGTGQATVDPLTPFFRYTLKPQSRLLDAAG